MALGRGYLGSRFLPGKVCQFNCTWVWLLRSHLNFRKYTFLSLIKCCMQNWYLEEIFVAWHVYVGLVVKLRRWKIRSMRVKVVPTLSCCNAYVKNDSLAWSIYKYYCIINDFHFQKAACYVNSPTKLLQSNMCHPSIHYILILRSLLEPIPGHNKQLYSSTGFQNVLFKIA